MRGPKRLRAVPAPTPFGRTRGRKTAARRIVQPPRVTGLELSEILNFNRKLQRQFVGTEILSQASRGNLLHARALKSNWSWAEAHRVPARPI